MGHYDSCRDYDDELNIKKRDKAATKRLKGLADELGFEDKEFLIEIADNVSDYKTFFMVLSRQMESIGGNN